MPVRMGSMEQPDYVAVNTEFRSNELSGVEFGIMQQLSIIHIGLLDPTINLATNTENL
jgi:hypothetical protein